MAMNSLNKDEIGNEDLDENENENETSDELDDDEWLKRAQTAYEGSTTFIDNNFRKTWERDIANFNLQHPADSKFNSPLAKRMSHIYRPKLRSAGRKYEASAALAFFSNADATSVSPLDDASQYGAASASLMKELLNYRLRVSIPWFKVLLGALQDALTIGAVVSEQKWRFEKRGEKVLFDCPEVNIIKIEDFRIDPDTSWLDPIESSPYLIHLRSYTVGQIREMIDSKEWLPVSNAQMLQAKVSKDDTTTQLRLNRVQDNDVTIDEYEKIEVQRHIHRHEGIDYEFYTLGTIALLSEPKPLEETVWTGKRPYVMGCAVLEAHKVYPVSMYGLGADLQEEANIIVNSRLDNVKLALNKRWFAKRGKGVDYASLLRNMPGSVTEMDDLEDVREISSPDVTASSYAEQDRLNVDADEILGNFSASSVQTNRQLNETVGGMKLLAGSSNVVNEYVLRTFVETWVEPVLRQLMLLEQNYESDQRIIAIAGEKAKLFKRFGIDAVTDQMLREELLLNVNVGMGATDPVAKTDRLVRAVQTAAAIDQLPMKSLNKLEIIKEIFGNIGYSDGGRFLNADEEDPEKAQMMATIAELTKELEADTAQNTQDNETKLAVEEIRATSREETERIRQHSANLRAVMNNGARLAETATVNEAKKVVFEQSDLDKANQISDLSRQQEGLGTISGMPLPGKEDDTFGKEPQEPEYSQGVAPQGSVPPEMQ